MEVKLYRQTWVGLPQVTRDRLKEIFNLRRDEGSIVNDGKLVSDGFSDEALTSINVESMQRFTGSKLKDFVELFKLTLTMLDKKPEDAVAEVVEPIKEVIEAGMTSVGTVKKKK